MESLTVKKGPKGLRTITPTSMLSASTAQLVTESRENAQPKKSSRVTLSSQTFQKDMELRQRYEVLISHGSSHPKNLDKNLNEWRKMILLEGLPPETEEEQRKYETEGTLRGRIWKILLRVRQLDANKYIDLVELGSASFYQKIRNDTFRTFKTNQEFKKRVPEEKLIRILNAFIHSCSTGSKLSYVQGMNVVCAPFLYVMPEVDAFFAFSQLVKFNCPLYFNPGIEGAFAGLKLLDEILKVVDLELYMFLIQKDLKADVYAMPPVLSFSAATPPLDELLRLWDFLFAFGVHLNVVCAVAQIVCIREELLVAEKPNKLLRTLPPLDSNLIISVAVQLVRQLPEDLYQQLVVHPVQSKKPSRKFNTLPKNFKAVNYDDNGSPKNARATNNPFL